jgi:fibronectin-binding autotransporter adhesin
MLIQFSFAIAAALVFAQLSSAARAQTTSWSGTTGSWFDAGNWTAGVPTGETTATISNGGTSQITAPDAVSLDLTVGGSVASSLHIADGGSLTTWSILNGARIGLSLGHTGMVTVTGIGSSWTIFNPNGLRVGFNGTGSVIVSDGATVNSDMTRIGEQIMGSGTVTVTGAGSTLSGSFLTVGRKGTLSIAAGGAVNIVRDTTTSSVGTGAIHFTTGTLTTGNLGMNPSQLTGAGTINTHGLVADLDLVFDQSHGLQQQIVLASSPAQNIAINLDVIPSSPDWTYTLGAGYRAQGSLTIADGKVVTSGRGLLAQHVGSEGVESVSGAGSIWNTGGQLTIGEYGSGQLTVSAGGKVTTKHPIPSFESMVMLGSSAEASGSIHVTGAGSLWEVPSETVARNTIVVGQSGIGSLLVENGGAASGLRTTMSIGKSAGGVGAVTVSGSGSSLSISGGNSELNVGEAGTGSFTVENGATASTTGVSIGLSGGSNGTATLRGAGSTWTVFATASPFEFVVGKSGTGSLAVSNGAVLSTNVDTYIGDNAGSNGTVSISGIGSTWTNGARLFVGDAGNGSLTIAAGAVVSNTTATIGNSSGSTGIVTVTGNGSRWTSSGNVVVSQTSSAPATLVVNAGATVVASSASGLTIGSAGKLAGDGGVIQGKVTNNGTVSPGNSAGLLTIDGNYTQSSTGKLIIELAGRQLGTSYDSLQITGSATLAGALNITLIDGFKLAPGDLFEVLHAEAGVFNSFTSTALPKVPAGLKRTLIYSNFKVLLEVSYATTAGDFDLDGDVDGADFVAWQANFPKLSGATISQGDADFDGDVDGADFVVWQTNFPFAPAPGAAPVPEPPAWSAMLVACGVLGLAARFVARNSPRTPGKLVSR